MRNLLVLGLLAAAAAAPAFAQEGEVSGNISLTTDYAFRGISQTDENAAVQGGIDYAIGNGYVGAWASNINFGTGGGNLELDLYGGYGFTFDTVSVDVGVIGYLYPGAADDGAELDYYEVYAKPSFALSDTISLGAAIYYSPEFTGKSGDAVYYEANGSLAVSPEFSVSGAVGHQTVDTAGFFNGEDEYTTWNVGGTYSMGGLDWDLRYIDTDVSGAAIYSDRVVLSVKRSM